MQIYNAFAHGETQFAFVGSFSTEELAEQALASIGVDLDEEDDYEILLTNLDDKVIAPLFDWTDEDDMPA